jgi:hypothetical protein
MKNKPLHELKWCAFILVLGVVANNKVYVYATLSARVILLQTQLQTPRRREELLPCIQVHLASVISKIIALLE